MLVEEIKREGEMRSLMLEEEYQDYQGALKNGYFDSNTLPPNSRYESFFQIAVPKAFEKELKCLFISVDFGGETHTFCFECAKSKH